MRFFGKPVKGSAVDPSRMDGRIHYLSGLHKAGLPQPVVDATSA
jgi:hypothetical protein